MLCTCISMYVDRPSTVHVQCTSSILLKILFRSAQLIEFCFGSLLPFLILMHNRAEHTCIVVFNVFNWIHNTCVFALFEASDSVTNLKVALGRYKEQVDRLQTLHWR